MSSELLVIRRLLFSAELTPFPLYVLYCNDGGMSKFSSCF